MNIQIRDIKLETGSYSEFGFKIPIVPIAFILCVLHKVSSSFFISAEEHWWGRFTVELDCSNAGYVKLACIYCVINTKFENFTIRILY